MIKKETLYSLRDISIIPTTLTSIKSRSECNAYRPRIDGGDEEFLPLITAPMSCVLVEKKDYKKFQDSKVNTIIPRTIEFKDRLSLMTTTFCAFSMKEAEEILNTYVPKDTDVLRVLLDMANGHMKAQIELGKKLRRKFGDQLILMGGNIANPGTYLSYEYSGAFDYVRCGIGGGKGCLSSTQLGVHYPMASLLSDICDIRPQNYRCKVVADGGISGYSDIIKCLALGADYVMCGSIFTKAALSDSELGDHVAYYGMSTKQAQSEMGATKFKTSEGKHETLQKEYTLSGWTENMTDYLRSAMSYCDSRTLDEFRTNAQCQVISSFASHAINDK